MLPVSSVAPAIGCLRPLNLDPPAHSVGQTKRTPALSRAIAAYQDPLGSIGQLFLLWFRSFFESRNLEEGTFRIAGETCVRFKLESSTRFKALSTAPFSKLMS